MKKGFTLIELLGVVILLAVVALIATPIVLNAISDAQESADMSSAQLIVSSGHNYYASSLLDEEKASKIENNEDIYNELNIMNKPETGQLYVNSNDKVAMAVIINNKCYKKDYMSEIEVVDVSECDLGYMGPDDTAPTVELEIGNTNINENGWYKEDIYLKIKLEDTESGVFGYKRCMSQSECEPDETIYTNDTIIINTESVSNYVCIIGVDKRGNESEKLCEIYKLDKTAPVAGTANFTGTIGSNSWYTSNVTVNKVNGSDALSGHSSTTSSVTSITSNTANQVITITTTDLAGNTATRNYTIKVDKNTPTLTAKSSNVEITEGESNTVSNYFTVSYGISGGSLSCSPTNTSTLPVGNQTVSCTATGGNGKQVTSTKQMTVKANIPEPASFAEDSWETIANAVKNNNTSKYNVGDTKEVEVNGYGTFTVRIANKSTPSECSTSKFSQTACGFVVEFVDIITTHNMNSTSTNLGGWPGSSMYSFVNKNIYNSLPSDLQNAIIDTYTVSGHSSDNSTNFTSIDKLYLLSPKELDGNIDNINNFGTDAYLTKQLDYYKNINYNYTSNYTGAIKTYRGQNIQWWLRTPNVNINSAFFIIGQSGNSGGTAAADITYPTVPGVAPAFRIG